MPEDITAVVGYQFRYDSQDPRARYLVREIDPSDLTEVQVSGASTWHEYVGGSIFHDLALRRGVAGLMPTPWASITPTRPLKRGHGTRCRVFKPWMVPSSHPRPDGARTEAKRNLLINANYMILRRARGGDRRVNAALSVPPDSPN